MIVMPSATKISPESVPSQTATSPESSLTESIELFSDPRRERTEIELDVYGRTHLYDESTDLSVRSDVSVASAGDVALLNEGGMGLPSKSDPSFYYESSEGSESNLSPGHCQSPFDFAPTNLSTMFSIFDSSHRKDRRTDDSHSVTNSVNDAVTEVASNIDHSVIVWERKIDSLEREIATLKEIIKADSVTILCLKTDLSALQEKETKWIAKRSQHDCELCTEQELSYEAKIQELEEKIKLLSEPRVAIEVSGDGEQLRLQNELFASQIIDNETEILETRKMMSQIAEENVNLSMELADLKTNSEETVNPLKMEVDAIAEKLADLERKVESGLFCHCSPNRDERFAKPSEALPYSDRMRNMLDEGVSSESLEYIAAEAADAVKTTNVLVHCDGVEVTIAGDTITSAGISESFTDKCLGEHNQSSLPGSNDNAGRKKKSDAVDQQCSFCDCLRIVEKDCQ